MFGSIRKKDYLHPFIIWILLLLWYLIFAGKFFSAPQSRLDNFVTEQSFWFFNQPPKETQDITIVKPLAVISTSNGPGRGVLPPD
jgi:hypothetical protein